MWSITGSRMARASSGSRSASSSIEPLRSAKSTVTCLRSPSSALLDVRIFSARCFGVYASGETCRLAAGASTGWPHSRQKLASAGNVVAQRVQVRLKVPPHPRQNFAWAGLLRWQRGHSFSGAASWPVVTGSPRPPGQQRRRDGQAERLGRLEVDDQLKLRDLLDGQIRWLDALQNPHDVPAGSDATDGPKIILIGEECAPGHPLPAMTSEREPSLSGEPQDELLERRPQVG